MSRIVQSILAVDARAEEEREVLSTFEAVLAEAPTPQHPKKELALLQTTESIGAMTIDGEEQTTFFPWSLPQLQQSFSPQQQPQDHIQHQVTPKQQDFFLADLSKTQPISPQSSKTSPSHVPPPNGAGVSSERSSSVLCDVCLTPTSRHIFYGGQVCESCRGFFRRSVQSGRATTTRGYCDPSRPCIVDSKGRKGCPRCRFQKCLEAGMRPELVNAAAVPLQQQQQQQQNGDGSQRARRRNKSGRRSPTETTTAVALRSPAGSPVLPWTMEEELEVMSVVDSIKTGYFEVISQILVSDGRAFSMMRDILTNRTPPDPLLFKELERESRRAFLNSTVNLDAMRMLGGREGGLGLAPSQLAEAAFPTYWSVAEATFFSSSNMPRYLKEYLDFLRCKAEASGHPRLEEAVSSLEGLDLQSATSATLRYHSIYVTPWSPSAEQEEEHRRINSQLKAWARPGGGEAFDEVLVVLSVFASVFAPPPATAAEGGWGSAGKTAAEIRRKTMVLLSRYLRNKYGGRRARELMAQSVAIREVATKAYNIHCCMLPV